MSLDVLSYNNFEQVVKSQLLHYRWGRCSTEYLGTGRCSFVIELSLILHYFISFYCLSGCSIYSPFVNEITLFLFIEKIKYIKSI